MLVYSQGATGSIDVMSDVSAPIEGSAADCLDGRCRAGRGDTDLSHRGKVTGRDRGTYPRRKRVEKL